MKTYLRRAGNLKLLKRIINNTDNAKDRNGYYKEYRRQGGKLTLNEIVGIKK